MLCRRAARKPPAGTIGKLLDLSAVTKPTVTLIAAQVPAA